ncbi:ATP-dependent RecD-like DNA helicase [Devosia ginsengisoli]|uniref:ATP-dependent DNA helicase n=1 Tax=Devosia ginsengisoli TaxID=400770 RepID=UPI0026F1FB95|nr:AAA family ATPase [Devosia ginsengisoli]MCR6673293.1 AAA family ATPase [Devosia ginsengisoli]
MIWAPQQDDAIRAVRAWLADPRGKQFFYLAGFAGTGKTTIAKALAQDAGDVAYAAFTGKAALVLRGKGCADASTIHSLIYKPVEGSDGITRFKLDPDSRAGTVDLIVIDEVSMVGGELGRDLMTFGTRILVLGDPAQLPPVGDGAGFFTSGEPDFMLTEIHRQAADNPIIRLATEIRMGGSLELGAYGTSLIIDRRELGQKMVLGADQVLCGMNKTRRATNEKIRKLLGRAGRFHIGERIVALKNNKDKGLLNGSIWSVEDIELSDLDESDLVVKPLDAGMGSNAVQVHTHHAWLDGRERELPFSKARDYDPFDYAYCLSVHKAQGSQWDHVLIIDESYVFKEDRAKHLYTAITRAAERVTVAI